MSSYTKSTDFASKDSLLTGNPLKTVKGTEIDDEFNSIQTAVNSKADLNAPALVNPTATTQPASDSTTKVATTAMVQSALDQSNIVDTAQIVSGAVTSAKLEANSNGKGTRTVSTSDPSGGSNGDIWYKVSS